MYVDNKIFMHWTLYRLFKEWRFWFKLGIEVWLSLLVHNYEEVYSIDINILIVIEGPSHLNRLTRLRTHSYTVNIYNIKRSGRFILE